MIIAILFTILHALCGIALSEIVFRKHAFINRIWLGLTLGLLLLTWLPSLFAFLIGFTTTAQILSAVVSFLGILACAAVDLYRRKHRMRNSYAVRPVWFMLPVVIFVIVLGAALLNTHVLYRHDNGSAWVGQVTYGDLAMHLGFITSIAEQTAFPPQYSIFPGHPLNYPFLCETSGASLYQLGASARQAYIITAMYAYTLVAFGVYLFFRQWLKKDTRAATATVLFFFGGGFGFFYFFDLTKDGGILGALLGTENQTVAQTLLDGFYQTPTNIPALGLRWVNPIVDMLIPQRATLFGWAILFPCLYLLHGFAFEKKRENAIMLGILAGSLPLIHTHSFLALGIISAVYCFTDLIKVHFKKERLIGWFLYAAVACLLAAPQLFGFAFRQASESGLVRLHLNWGNTTDSYLWFYIKNLGLLFLMMPFAFLLLSRRDREIYTGVLAVWLISELIEFQPNDYDNNKLLFIWFAFTCGMVAKWMCVYAHQARHRICMRYSRYELTRTTRIGVFAILAILAVYCLCKLIKAQGSVIRIPVSTAMTLLFLCGLLLTLTVGTIMLSEKRSERVALAVPGVFSLIWIILLCLLWYRQYQSNELQIPATLIKIVFALALIGLLLPALIRILQSSKEKKRRYAPGILAMTVLGYLLIFAMTVSSAMTILRELKSEYQVYTKDEIELSAEIKANTEPDAVLLANSYHWNLVTPLTGRSIVTGTGTFLYYHGIDTTKRETDVRLMYEQPEQNSELFREYGVRYILVSSAERYHYDIDYKFLETQCDIAAQNSSGTLYSIHD